MRCHLLESTECDLCEVGDLFEFEIEVDMGMGWGISVDMLGGEIFWEFE